MPKSTKTSRLGRSSKCFNESSERFKGRKTECLRDFQLDTLVYGTVQKMFQEGRRVASQVLNDLKASQRRAQKYKQA